MLDRRDALLRPPVGGLGTAERRSVFGGPLVVRRYAPRPAAWPRDLRFRAALLTDIHAGMPSMPLERLAAIVDAVNGLGADAILLGGDYLSSMKLPFRRFAPEEWARELGRLAAPCGVFAVLGNHDHGRKPGPGLRPDDGRTVRAALEAAGIAVLENEAAPLRVPDGECALLGLASQRVRKEKGRWVGADDLDGLLRSLDDERPALLLAHEPDIFPRVPHRVALTLSGHTHGGQVRIADRALIVPSRYGARYAWGHCIEDDRHLVVSGGVGVSGWPIRFGIDPEIVLVDLGHSDED